MVDPLYARLNSRGKKQFKASDPTAFAKHFADYANLGLPAHKAALEGNVECLKECFCSFGKEGVPSRDVNGATPLHLAARNNRADAVKWLLRFTDLSPTVTAKHGETPAHVAAAQGHVGSLKPMLSADGKGDIKSQLATAIDNSGFSVLHLAIMKHRNECAKLVISELGSKAVSTLNESGVTAVHLAASAGNVEVLQFLSNKYKKLFNQEDSEGASPVYYAAQEGRLAVLQFMCEKCKCDLGKACSDGLKPIHAASQCGHTNIIKYIVSRLGNQSIFDTTPDGATPLHFATSTGQEHTAQWIMNTDASGTIVTMKDSNGDTPAHDAAENGHVPMLKLLLENSADLYAINNDGSTPYSLALSGGNMDTANFVMTYASKSPRESTSSLRIFNMQGDVDIVRMNKSPVLTETPLEPSLPLPQKANEEESKKKDKKKNKKEKSEKGINTSNSFLGNASQTLQSFSGSNTGSEVKEGTDIALDMTEDELTMFNENKHLIGTAEDDNIVVRYSAPGAMNPILLGEKPAEPGYATVNEIALIEAKKGEKKGRIKSKSVQKGKKASGSSGKIKVQPSKGISGPEMGFKPQFRSNPLVKMGISVPPTPPPTPATGASIAPSDETPPHYMEDMEGMEDDSGFATYATPDPEVVRMKARQRRLEEQNILKSSENQKLLKDALEDLSGDDSPPEIPKKKFDEDVPSRVSDDLSQQGSRLSFGSTKTGVDSGQQNLEWGQVKLKSRPVVSAEEEATKSKFPALKSTRRDIHAAEKVATNEFSQIKLKKAKDRKIPEYNHETASGASDELKNRFKKVVN